MNEGGSFLLGQTLDISERKMASLLCCSPLVALLLLGNGAHGPWHRPLAPGPVKSSFSRPWVEILGSVLECGESL